MSSGVCRCAVWLAVELWPTLALTVLIVTLMAIAPPWLSPSLVMLSLMVAPLASLAPVLPDDAEALPKIVASAMSGFDRMSLYLVGLNLPPTSGLALAIADDVKVACTPMPSVEVLVESV